MPNLINSFKVRVETTIQAECHRVWHCLVNETTEWWKADFYTNPKTRDFRIEARIGGRAYEDFGNGEGLVWSEVIGVDSPKALHMKGLLSPDFGGPAISYTAIELKSDGKGTLFSLTDTYFGVITEDTLAQIESGWRMIYTEAFKHYVESN